MIRLMLDGVVDMDRHAEVRAKLLSALDGASELRVNLEQVSYIDSSGLSALIEANQVAQAANARLVLENASEAVKRVMVVSCLDSLFVFEQDESMAAQASEASEILGADLDLDDVVDFDDIGDPSPDDSANDPFADLDDLSLDLEDEPQVQESSVQPDLAGTVLPDFADLDAGEPARNSPAVQDYDDDPLNQA